MAVSDNRHRYMPLPDDRSSGRCQALAYPEVVLLVDPKMKDLAGEVFSHNFLLYITVLEFLSVLGVMVAWDY